MPTAATGPSLHRKIPIQDPRTRHERCVPAMRNVLHTIFHPSTPLRNLCCSSSVVFAYTPPTMSASTSYVSMLSMRQASDKLSVSATVSQSLRTAPQLQHKPRASHHPPQHHREIALRPTPIPGTHTYLVPTGIPYPLSITPLSRPYNF